MKVHVWAGISKKGATPICIFDGTMDAVLFISILDRTLVPFLKSVFPDGHRYMQDNDPKHTSRVAKDFFENKDINWWKTPAESPDLNPIEHELNEVKPKTKAELVNGILAFWKTVDVAKCTKYINHLA